MNRHASPLTDEDLRLDYLINVGLTLGQAKEAVETNPPTYGEAWAILRQRITDLGLPGQALVEIWTWRRASEKLTSDPVAEAVDAL